MVRNKDSEIYGACTKLHIPAYLLSTSNGIKLFSLDVRLGLTQTQSIITSGDGGSSPGP
jgi:hypothetical protein